MPEKRPYTLRNAELAAAGRALTRILEARGLPASLTFRLVRLARELEGPARDLEAAELRLLEEYADRDPETGRLRPAAGPDGGEVPGSVRIRPGDEAAFQAELRELHATEVELSATPVALDEYLHRLDAAGVELPSDALFALGGLLEA